MPSLATRPIPGISNYPAVVGVCRGSKGWGVPTVAVFVLAAITIGFWFPCLFLGKQPVASQHQSWMLPWRVAHPPEITTRRWDALLWDSVAQFYPWRLLLARGLRNGELPLWSPYQYCGYPFVGNGQSGIFYPPNWLLALVPAGKFLGLSLALHFLIAGLLTFYLCRLLGLSDLPALFAALAFSYGGFAITWALLPTLVASAVWLPGALAGIELTVRGRPRRGMILLAVCLGLTLLAGHMQIAAYVWMTAVVYAVGRVVYCAACRQAVVWWPLAAGAGLGLALGMAQLLPTMELGMHSPRGSQVPSEAGWEFQRQRFLTPGELTTFLSPDALGTPVRGDYGGLSYSEHCGFAGAATLLLGLVAVALRRDRLSWAFAAAIVVVLSMIMGGPLARLAYFYVPKIGLTGSFARLLFVYILCVAILGALGLDHLMRRISPNPRFRSMVSYLLGAGLILVLLAELLPWGRRFVPMQPATQAYAPTELTHQLQQRCNPTEGRVLAITPRRAWSLFNTPLALLPPNSATVYGYHSPQGYDSLSVSEYYQFAARMEHSAPAPIENGNMMLLENYISPLLADAAVKWIISMEPLRSENLELLWHGEGAYLYQTRTPPRFRVVHSDGNIVEPRAVDIGLNYVKVHLPQGSGGTLIAADAWYPGWYCFAGDQPVPIERYRGIFRQVQIPAGARRLLMAYYPTSVLCGLFLSLVALTVLVALGCVLPPSLTRK